jgi:hypothetical protein
MFKNQFKPNRIVPRYSRTPLASNNRVIRKFVLFWGDRKLSTVTHLDIRAFLIDVSKTDLSADVMHRYIWHSGAFSISYAVAAASMTWLPGSFAPNQQESPLALKRRFPRAFVANAV